MFSSKKESSNSHKSQTWSMMHLCRWKFQANFSWKFSSIPVQLVQIPMQGPSYLFLVWSIPLTVQKNQESSKLEFVVNHSILIESILWPPSCTFPMVEMDMSGWKDAEKLLIKLWESIPWDWFSNFSRVRTKWQKMTNIKKIAMRNKKN